MSFFKRRHPQLSPTTVKRLERAEKDYKEQKVKHEQAVEVKERLEHALAENHLAELLYEALSDRRNTL